ncbi:MAG: hypothetical protein R3C53_22245 [Pirellulaceae bacterium]
MAESADSELRSDGPLDPSSGSHEESSTQPSAGPVEAQIMSELPRVTSAGSMEPPIVFHDGWDPVRSNGMGYNIGYPSGVHGRGLQETGLDVLKQAFGSEAYGAPRVFDLFTLLAITLAFALLFGGIQFLKPALGEGTAATTAVIAAYVTGIAVAQLALFEGNLPRLASIIAGPVVWIIVGTSVGLLEGSAFISAALGALCSAPFGLFAGYLGGAVVAGVFLVADGFRAKFMPNELARPSSDAVGFDELE